MVPKMPTLEHRETGATLARDLIAVAEQNVFEFF
jgi:hypothetical protein